MKKTTQLLSATCLALIAHFSPVLANDEFKDIAANTIAKSTPENTTLLNTEKSEEDDSGQLQGYFKVGYGYKVERGPYEDDVDDMSLFINGRYDWHGFFIESFYGANERDQGVSIGYNFYNTPSWSFDVNTVLAHGELKAEVYNDEQSLIQQSDSTTMLALRATGQFGDTSIQLTGSPYSFNDENDGYFAAAWLSKAWYAKNWEIFTSVGVKYYSEEFLEYYYEISPEEAIDQFSEYSPGAGFDVIGQVSASYPISERWLFESYVKYTDISDEILANPIMDYASGLSVRDKNITEFGILVSYVF